MTIEEAIFILANIDRRVCDDELSEALDMAIKALEQEPISETDIILTREEYGELVSSEYDNGYAKGYEEALEQESYHAEPETWNGIHARITAPKGTFKRIYNDTESE